MIELTWSGLTPTYDTGGNASGTSSQRPSLDTYLTPWIAQTEGLTVSQLLSHNMNSLADCSNALLIYAQGVINANATAVGAVNMDMAHAQPYADLTHFHANFVPGAAWVPANVLGATATIAASMHAAQPSGVPLPVPPANPVGVFYPTHAMCWHKWSRPVGVYRWPSSHIQRPYIHRPHSQYDSRIDAGNATLVQFNGIRLRT
jgi:hypothetical protein